MAEHFPVPVEIQEDGLAALWHEEGMTVPVSFFVGPELLPPFFDAERLRAIASLPGVVGRVAILPDFHFTAKNYVPAGIAMATTDAIYPRLSGPPNDGMCAVQTSLVADDLSPGAIDATLASVREAVAVFRRSKPKFDSDLIEGILVDGPAEVAKQWGFTAGDMDRLEYQGRFPWAEELRSAPWGRLFPSDANRPSTLPGFVPYHDVITAGRHSLGAIDGGSHFLELDAVDQIVDGLAAERLGLCEGQVLMTLHAGSADVGLITHHLFYQDDASGPGMVPMGSAAGYRLRATRAAATQFAWANRLFIMAAGRDALAEAVGRAVDVSILSDVSHDLVEPIEYGSQPAILYRKGAARALPASVRPDDATLGAVGLPFYFPSHVGGASYVLSHPEGNPESFFSCSHGAGRMIDKDEAVELYSGQDVVVQMHYPDVRIVRYGFSEFSGQAPLSFKNMGQVLDTLRAHDLARPIVRLRPLGVLKP